MTITQNDETVKAMACIIDYLEADGLVLPAEDLQDFEHCQDDSEVFRAMKIVKEAIAAADPA